MRNWPAARESRFLDFEGGEDVMDEDYLNEEDLLESLEQHGVICISLDELELY